MRGFGEFFFRFQDGGFVIKWLCNSVFCCHELRFCRPFLRFKVSILDVRASFLDVRASMAIGWWRLAKSKRPTASG